MAVADGPTMRFPAVARDVCDVTGAGDTVVAVMALAVGIDFPRAASLANRAAGIVVGKFGSAVVDPFEICVA